MKQVSQELRYDGATLEQVHEMLADEGFREHVCDAQHVLRHTVSVDAAGRGMSVRIDQVRTATGMPGFAKKFVGEEINVIQTEDWTGPEKGTIQFVIPGKPGEISGTVLLTEDPEGTTETVNLTVKVNIPLVGGKIEGLVADLITHALRAEHGVGVAWQSRTAAH